MNQGTSLPVMEHFHTLQGEGFYTGHSAYFIRLAGCDVGCPWCDVKESWDSSLHPKVEISTLINSIKASQAPIAVITGGEPTLHPLNELTKAIREIGVRTHIETSGTNPLTGEWDWITFSPKRYKKPLNSYFDLAHELKIIIAHPNDLRWALEFQQKTSKNTQLYIQPEWEVRTQLEPLCIDFVKQNPQWKLSIQTHKYLGID